MTKVFIDGINGPWVSKDGTPYFYKGINELVKVEVPDELLKEYGEISHRYHELNRKFQAMYLKDKREKPSCPQCGRSYTIGFCEDCKEMNSR